MQHSQVELKTVGRSGQISIGKQYAGRALRIEHQQNGVMILTPVAMVPEHQLWTTREPERSKIERGMQWAAATKRQETSLERLEKKAFSRKIPGGKRHGPK